MESMIFLSLVLAALVVVAAGVLARDLRAGGGGRRTGEDPAARWDPSLPSRPYGHG